MNFCLRTMSHSILICKGEQIQCKGGTDILVMRLFVKSMLPLTQCRIKALDMQPSVMCFTSQEISQLVAIPEIPSHLCSYSRWLISLQTGFGFSLPAGILSIALSISFYLY